MKKVVLSVLALALFAPLTGCMGVASPAVGIVYSDVQWNGDAEGPIGGKKGEACANSYLALFATGDASLAAAAANGGIKTVTAVDHHSTNILGLIGTYCTTVYGN